jgi:hypothetical protein
VAQASTSYREPISRGGGAYACGELRPASRCLSHPSRSTSRRQPGQPSTCFHARSSSAGES